MSVPLLIVSTPTDRGGSNDYIRNPEYQPFHLMFKEIEEHVITHQPCEIADFYSGQSETIRDYSFRGITFYPDAASMGFIIGCSCGRGWSISLMEFRSYSNTSSAPPDYILRDFCERINRRYVREVDREFVHHFRQEDFVAEYGHHTANDPMKPKNTNKPKKKKVDKPLKFDNAIDGLEI